MIKNLIVIALLTTTLNAKLLDKIAGVVNDNVITISEVDRIQNTLLARKEIAPIIYKENKYSKKDILKLIERTLIIRDHLAQVGYIVSDDRVESRIKETEKRLGLTRARLQEFLNAKKISFSEYFELIREAMEFNIFSSNIIGPLVNITEQEVKNYYYKLNKANKALSFKFNLADYTYNASSLSDGDKKSLPLYLEEYIKTGNIPEAYKNFEVNNLDSIVGDDLPKDLQVILNNTDEGSFSQVYTKDGISHVFYLKNKDLTESQEFIKLKPRISNALFIKRSESIIKSWIRNKSLEYYILENI